MTGHLSPPIEVGPGETELTVRVKVDVFGRLGSFGLNVMKTKADRMWEEFGQNFIAKVAAASSPTGAGARVTEPAEATLPAATSIMEGVAKPIPPVMAPATTRVDHQPSGMTSWWRRFLGAESSEMIRVEISRGTDRIVIHWPARAGQDCAAWLNSYLSQ